MSHQDSDGTRTTTSAKDKSKIKYFSCNNYGHYASECRSKSHVEEAHLTCVDDDGPMLLLIVSQENIVMLNVEKAMSNQHAVGEA